ncbi:hypothetical protein L1987_61133 [Smallanthus sonchifolius]|uniref:Uncharacterized protein n=1 Tax=Smallanthus sonchifolius TaxID=185202 RepID=A0ACB9D9X5_9ASTR|nr:hypothetical protein L1987_61133 [Smallanthus sonchifolius]
MTDEYGDENLITLTENFLIEVLATWADIMKALESCEQVLHDAEEVFLISRCITSLARKACMGFNEKVPTSTIWNGITTTTTITNKAVITYDDWWHKDVSFLGLNLYKRVIRAIASRGMKPETIAGSLCPLMKQIKEVLLRIFVELFPNRKGIIATTFLVRILRTAIILHVGPACQENLEKRVGARLESAVLEDVLVPNQGFNTLETLYDIDCFQRILEYFLSMDQASSSVCSPCIVEEGSEGGCGAQSLEAMTSIANLVDMFLADVAADVNLKLLKFQSLAASVPDYARPASDGIYRSIDIYFKVGRAETLTSIAGWFYVSENEGGEVVRPHERGGVGGGGKAGRGEMRKHVLGL